MVHDAGLHDTDAQIVMKHPEATELNISCGPAVVPQVAW